MSHQTAPKLPLPVGWPKPVRSAMVHIISLAHYAIVAARGWAANSINARVRLAADNDGLKEEAALLHEKIRVKDARMGRIDARRRPHYCPTDRMAILELMAGRGVVVAGKLHPVVTHLRHGREGPGEVLLALVANRIELQGNRHFPR